MKKSKKAIKTERQTKKRGKTEKRRNRKRTEGIRKGKRVKGIFETGFSQKKSLFICYGYGLVL